MVLFQEQLSVVKEALKHQITPLSLRTLHFTYHCSAYVNLVILSFDKVYTDFGVRFSRPRERYFIGSRSRSKIPRYMALLPEAVSCMSGPQVHPSCLTQPVLLVGAS